MSRGMYPKVENLAYAVCLHFIFYNFGRIHKTLRVTPAMEAGISDHVWSLKEIAALAVQYDNILSIRLIFSLDNYTSRWHI